MDQSVLLQQRVERLAQRSRDELHLLNQYVPLDGLAVWENHTWRSPLPNEVPGRDSRIRIVHLWDVDCPPCRHEMPRLARMDKQLQGDYQRQVRMVMVSETVKSEDMQRFEKMGIQLTGEQRGDTGRTLMRLVMQALPQTIEAATRGSEPSFGREPPLPITLVLDSENIVRLAFVGSLEGRQGELINGVEQLWQIEKKRTDAQGRPARGLVAGRPGQTTSN